MRPTKDFYDIFVYAKQLSGLETSGMFEAAERAVLADPDRLTPSLLQRVNVPHGTADIPSSLRIQVDADLHQRVTEIVQSKMQSSRIRQSFILKITCLRYIEFLLEQKKSDVSEKDKARSENEGASNDYRLKQLQVQAIKTILKEPDPEKIKELLEYYNWRIK